MAQFMQTCVAFDDLMIDPRIFAFCAAIDHIEKRFVDSGFKYVLAQNSPQRMRHVKIFQGKNGAWIG